MISMVLNIAAAFVSVIAVLSIYQWASKIERHKYGPIENVIASLTVTTLVLLSFYRTALLIAGAL